LDASFDLAVSRVRRGLAETPLLVRSFLARVREPRAERDRGGRAEHQRVFVVLVVVLVVVVHAVVR
jgi:hypothetical protein